MYKLKIFFLMALLSVILFVLGASVAGQIGLLIALFLTLLVNFFAYWFSDKLVLKMHKAQFISEDPKYKFLEDLLSETSILMDLKKPKLYVIESQNLNAFASGRNKNHSSIVLTTGLIESLDKEELKGVIAHELSHIKNNDILIGSIVALMSMTISNIAYFARWFGIFYNDDRGPGILETLLFIFFAPISAFLIQMAVSRTQEYRADNGAKEVGLSRNLVSALKKISINSSSKNTIVRPETAHMFIYNPFKNKGLQSLFMTHPPVNERIKKLLS